MDAARKKLEDKEMLLNGVREAASEFIEIIDTHLQLSKENEQDTVFEHEKSIVKNKRNKQSKYER